MYLLFSLGNENLQDVVQRRQVAGALCFKTTTACIQIYIYFKYLGFGMFFNQTMPNQSNLQSIWLGC
jgi:hypothetical protein